MLIGWNVFKEDINSKQIIKFNVFDHFGFLTNIIKMFKDIKKEQDKYRKENNLSGELTVKQYNEYEKYMLDFEDAHLNIVCMRNFWSKSEYEIVLTSWPPSIDKEEIYRLVNENKKHVKEWGEPAYGYSPNLCISEKIDIYDQLKLNWEVFKNYIFNNKKEIKKLYKNNYERYFKRS